MKTRHSILAIKCPLNLWKTLKKQKRECLPPDETVQGTERHELMKTALLKGDYSEIAELLGKNPQEVFAKLFETYGTPQVEVRSEYPLDDDMINYTADVVFAKDNETLVIDHKSSAQAYIEYYHQHQLLYYAFAQLIANPTAIVKTGIYFFKWNALLWGATYTNEDFEPIERLIRNDIKRAKKIDELTEPPRPLPTNMCAYCNYPLTCPEFPNLIIENPIGVVEELIKTEAKVKHLRKLAKMIVAQTGKNVLTTAMEAGYFDKEETEIDEVELLKYLKDKPELFQKCYHANVVDTKREAKKDVNLANYIHIETRIGAKWDIREIKEVF